ncbi:SpoIIE family protein phosphatase [Catenovulum maritimum]|uniref:PPM-type phosphatase domain-containing protein n=1 Tax=Catenovulum maritimum TaxID=1513271 RepID=A0A0J8GUR8_9ALTE|nr:SpoIIE family protein phosphatase [Catenovulum maritimum]KMT66497.1 hypothetical protein XM47_02860 [Catenovulum maritimum]
MNILYHKSFSLNTAILSEIRCLLVAICKKQNIADADMDNLGTGITEYLVNLLEHARAQDTLVTVSIGLNQQNLFIEIIDATPHFAEFYRYAKQGAINIAEGDLMVSGMGLGLIITLFPDCEYEKQEQFNRFCIQLNQNWQSKKVLVIKNINPDSPPDLADFLRLVELSLEPNFACTFIDSTSDTNLEGQLDKSYRAVVYLADKNQSLSREGLAKLSKLNQKLQALPIILVSSNKDNLGLAQTNMHGVTDVLLASQVEIELSARVEKSICRSSIEYLGYAELKQNRDRCWHNISANYVMSTFGSINHKCGGDFLVHVKKQDYDWVILGDVMGHDELARQESIMVQGFLLGCLQQENMTTALLAKKLSDALYQDEILEASLLTCLILKISNEGIDLINLGHPKPILFNPTNQYQEFGNIQPMLGLNRDTNYSSESFKLEQGDRLILVTDGVFENNDKQCLGIQWLETILKRIKNNHNLAEQVWLKALPKLSQEIDDASLVCLERHL